MTRRRNSRNGTITIRETREQAARAISCALDFLRREADAIGMADVGELIGRASEKANKYWPVRKVN